MEFSSTDSEVSEQYQYGGLKDLLAGEGGGRAVLRCARRPSPAPHPCHARPRPAGRPLAALRSPGGAAIACRGGVTADESDDDVEAWAEQKKAVYQETRCNSKGRGSLYDKSLGGPQLLQQPPPAPLLLAPPPLQLPVSVPAAQARRRAAWRARLTRLPAPPPPPPVLCPAQASPATSAARRRCAGRTTARAARTGMPTQVHARRCCTETRALSAAPGQCPSTAPDGNAAHPSLRLPGHPASAPARPDLQPHARPACRLHRQDLLQPLRHRHRHLLPRLPAHPLWRAAGGAPSPHQPARSTAARPVPAMGTAPVALTHCAGPTAAAHQRIAPVHAPAPCRTCATMTTGSAPTATRRSTPARAGSATAPSASSAGGPSPAAATPDAGPLRARPPVRRPLPPALCLLLMPACSPPCTLSPAAPRVQGLPVHWHCHL